MLVLFECGNFHSKSQMPLHKGLSLPSLIVLSFNQGLRWLKQGAAWIKNPQAISRVTNHSFMSPRSRE